MFMRRGLTLLLAFVMCATVAVPAVAQVEGKDPGTKLSPNKAGTKAYAAAYGLYRSRKYKESAAAFEAFVGKYPGHPSRTTAFYYASVCLRNAKDRDGAIRVALAHDKAFPGTNATHSGLYQAAGYLKTAKRYDEAIAIYEKLAADESYTNPYSVWSSIYGTHFAKKDYAACITAIDRYLKAYPEHKARAAEMLLRKQNCLVNLKRYDEVEPIAAKIAELNANSSSVGRAWEKVGYVGYYRTKAYDKAYTSYRRAALTLGYLNDETCMYMAVIARRNAKPTDWKATVAAYEDFLKLFPKSGNAARMQYDMSVIIGNYLKNYAKEYEVLEDWLKRYGETAYAEHALRRMVDQARRKGGIIEGGVKAAKDTIKRFPTSAGAERALYWLGSQQLKSDNAEEQAEGRKLIERIVKEFPAGTYADKAAALLK
jgi:TolA-binding protein